MEPKPNTKENKFSKRNHRVWCLRKDAFNWKDVYDDDDDNDNEKRMWNVFNKIELKMKMETDLECKESIFGCLFSFWFAFDVEKCCGNHDLNRIFKKRKNVIFFVGFVSFGSRWWLIIEIESNEFRNEKNNRKKV